jgi:hypothetical protein
MRDDDFPAPEWDTALAAYATEVGQPTERASHSMMGGSD